MKKKFLIELEPRLILPLSKHLGIPASRLITQLLVKANIETLGRVPLPEPRLITAQNHSRSARHLAVSRREVFRSQYFLGLNNDSALKAAIRLNSVPEELLYLTLGNILETRLKLISALSEEPRSVMHYTYVSPQRAQQIRVCPRVLFLLKDFLEPKVSEYLIKHLEKYPKEQELMPEDMELPWLKGSHPDRPIMRV